MRGLVHPRDIGQITRCRRPAQPVASVVSVVVPHPLSPPPPLPLSPPSTASSCIAPSPFHGRGRRKQLLSPSLALRLSSGRHRDFTPMPPTRGGKIHKTRVCALDAPSCSRYKRPLTERTELPSTNECMESLILSRKNSKNIQFVKGDNLCYPLGWKFARYGARIDAGN